MKRFLLVFGLLTLLATLAVAQQGFQGSCRQGAKGCWGINPANLTEQQKADMTEYQKKMLELRKEMIQKMVANGALTREQGDAALKKIEACLQARIDNPDGDFCGKGMKGNRKGCYSSCRGNTAPQQQ